MNRFRTFRKAAGMDMQTAANRSGIDVMQVALFENSLGWVPIDIAYRMSEVVEQSMGDLFPLLKDVFASVDKLEDEDAKQAAMFAPENLPVLVESGIDPDPRPWFAIVSLKSGNERRYFLTSMEYERIRHELLHTEDAEGFLAFHSDCRNVILRKSAIHTVRFNNNASYAYFASHESDFFITTVSDACPRPVVMLATPDGRESDERPFASLFQAARGEGGTMPPFFSMSDDPDELVISFDQVEVIEIPCGVMMPDLYEEAEEFAEGRGTGESLRSMEMQGSA